MHVNFPNTGIKKEILHSPTEPLTECVLFLLGTCKLSLAEDGHNDCQWLRLSGCLLLYVRHFTIK